MKNQKYILTLICAFSSMICMAQQNVIPVSVPFLGITPDARAAGMGEIGVATPSDAYSSFWNPGKSTFSDNEGAISASYSPYLRAIAPGMDLLNISGFMKTNYNTSAGYYLKYMSMGETVYRDESGIEHGLKRPFDFTIGGSYSIRLSEGLGIGAGLKYVHSSVNTIGDDNIMEIKSAQAVSVDLGVYYERYIQDTKLSYGLTLNNIGTKINYSNTNASFQPMSLKIGAAANFLAGLNGSLTIGLDVSKPLTPTPPKLDDDGNVIAGKKMDKNVFNSMISSFYDAPNGVSETIQGLSYGVGGEYDYMQQFFFRAGFVYEHKNKGERRYGTIGLGFKYHNFGIDGAYFLPIDDKSPYKNSTKITLSFTLE